jgi:hypothetical protein
MKKIIITTVGLFFFAAAFSQQSTEPSSDAANRERIRLNQIKNKAAEDALLQLRQPSQRVTAISPDKSVVNASQEIPARITTPTSIANNFAGVNTVSENKVPPTPVQSGPQQIRVVPTDENKITSVVENKKPVVDASQAPSSLDKVTSPVVTISKDAEATPVAEKIIPAVKTKTE